jgi:hypothetical protein
MSYESEQKALISSLRQRSPDGWHLVADALNWDFAVDATEWIVSQPQCDVATAALLFWKAYPEKWLKYSDADAIPDYHLHNFNFVNKLAERANSGFYTRRELAFAGKPSNMMGGVDYTLKFQAKDLQRCFEQGPAKPFSWNFPTLLMPPIPGRAANVLPEENPKTGAEIQELLAELWTNIGDYPELSKPQKFQIGERVTNIWYPVNNIYPGFGTILNVNDSDYKCFVFGAA